MIPDRRVLLWIVAQAVCAVVLFMGIADGRFQIRGDISTFEHSNSEGSELDAVWTELRGQQTGQGSVLLSHQDPDRAVGAALALKAALMAHPGLFSAELTGQNPEDQQLSELLLQAFPGVVSRKDRQDLEQSEGEGILARALAGLTIPGMALSFTDPARDPFNLTGLALISAFDPAIPDQLIGGVPVFRSADGVSHVRVPFQADGVNDLEGESDLAAAVRAVVAETLQDRPQVQVHFLGGVFFSADIAKASRAETERLTLLSALWVLAVIVASMRSVRILIATALVLGLGLLWGGAAAALIWGSVNTVALGFAGGLLGVVADYIFHYFLARPDCDKCVALATRKALLFGALSSAVGFASLLFASFDLLAQIAVIACAGIAAAMTTILILFPAIGLLPIPTNQQQALFSAKLRRQHIRIAGFLGYSVMGLALLAGGFLSLQPPSDDVRTLGHAPEALLRDAELGAELFPSTQISRFLVVEADDSQELLEQLESIAPALRGLQQLGQITSAFVISDLIPSLSQQSETAALVKNGLAPRWARVTGLPFVVPKPELLTIESVQAVAPQHRALQVVHHTHDGRVWAAVPIVGGTTTAVSELAQRFEGVYLMDPVDGANRAFEQSRRGAQYALLAALVLLWTLFCMRDGVAHGTRLALVPAAAVVAAPALAALVGVPLNLLTVMSLFLVLAIGADYAIFLGDPDIGSHPETYRAVSLSALSSVGAFAILGSSSLPAIHQIGSVLCAGLTVAWLLSPFSTHVIGTNK
ncbi:hypothetical protein RA27_17200 [Ruegeria sp. ANG-R]|uniref:hypothetical protein n=1 Tax=Ruegeria sp. ANG-R TaxID=1577903 RepID=UPI00057D951B|nr:hypothetical protein [Ruegeria sp. ANG-R]KIC39799.1 hypothetical protein RA27_17200 [Ruegeria sp. ANG-R]